MVSAADDSHEDLTKGEIPFGVLTVSSSRSAEEDESGDLIISALRGEGHSLVDRRLVPDHRDLIASELRVFLDGSARLIVVNGGTGISRRDVTPEVVRDFFDRRLPGFGELFRNLSYEQIGPRAALSRAVGGTVKDKFLFALPGSKAAVELGVKEIISPLIGHGLYELDKELDKEGG